MEHPRLKIFQYDAMNETVGSGSPDDTNEDKTRWIAAIDDLEADRLAKENGWTPCGGEILKNHNYYTVFDYLGAGVDVVAFPPVYENHYACPDCCEEWNDVWDSACDDECPNCGMRDISPIETTRLS